MTKTRTHTCNECGIQYEVAVDLMGDPSHGEWCFRELVKQLKEANEKIRELEQLTKRFRRVK